MSDSPSLGTRASRTIVACLLYALAWTLRALPHAATLAVGRRFGRLLCRFMPARRRVAEANLRRAFPELTSEQRGALTAEHFEHLGLVAAEVLVLPQWDRRFADKVRIDGREALDASIKDGAGCVVFVPHLGNWELLAAVWPSLHPNPMVLALPIANPGVDRLLRSCRTVTGIELVDRAGGLRRGLAALRQGRAVGFLADQDGGGRGVFVPIFDELASSERSPVSIARRLGCSVLLCTTYREQDGSHRVMLERVPPADPQCEDPDYQALAWIYSRLEDHIRDHPAQWLWIHRRWKTRPQESAS